MVIATAMPISLKPAITPQSNKTTISNNLISFIL